MFFHGGECKNGGSFQPFHKEEIGELLAKNIASRQLDGRHLLFREYLRS